MKELKITNKTLPVIESNFEEVKSSLDEALTKYKGIVVTDDNLKDCKKMLADLNKLKTSIDTYRKDTKREFNIPVKDFENKCKELENMIIEVQNPTKKGISVFDEKKKQEKRAKILEFIGEVAVDLNLDEKYAKQLTISPKYLNVSTSLKSIREDLQERGNLLLQQQNAEIEKINNIKAVLDSVNKTINTPVTFKDINYLVQAEKPLSVIIERINAIAEKIRIAEQPKPQKEEPKTEPTPQVQHPTNTNFGEIKAERVAAVKKQEYFVTFKIQGTADITRMMGNFLRQNNIKYTVIEKGIAD